MGMIFWCIICFLIGVFVGIITMCFTNISSASENNYDEDDNNKNIEYTGNFDYIFDDNPREDNNSFND